jgi:protein O-mannosyl-transferase
MVSYEVAGRFSLRARDLAATLPLLAAGAALAWVNLAGNPIHGARYHGGSPWVTLRTSCTVVPRYLGNVFAPLSLTAYYEVPLRTSWLEPAVLASVLLILGLVAAAAVLIVRRRRGAFWIAWFGLTLAPMLNLVPFPALMADRYLYIPLLGPLVLAAWGACGLARHRAPLRRTLPALVGIAVGLCVWLTAARIPVFHDDITLWADWALRKTVAAVDVPSGGDPNRLDLVMLREALLRDPESPVLHNNLGAIAFELNDIPNAIGELERARAGAPADPLVALNLGRAYLHGHQPALAARTLEEAVRLRPASYYAHLNLARAYNALGDLPRAREELDRAAALGPELP